jgi:hypothetical protein
MVINPSRTDSAVRTPSLPGAFGIERITIPAGLNELTSILVGQFGSKRCSVSLERANLETTQKGNVGQAFLPAFGLRY